MKKSMILVLALSVVLALAVLLVLFLFGESEVPENYEINIWVPAGSVAKFVYSDAHISPLGKEITIRSGQGLGDTEVVLLPVEGHTETTYEPTYLTPGMPVTMKVEKGVWYEVGVSVQNPTEEVIKVTVVAEGVEIRIP